MGIYHKELQRKRTRSVKTLPIIFGKEICSICQNRKRFAAIYLLIDVDSPQLVEVAAKEAKRCGIRLGVYLCKPCAKRIVERIEANIDQGWH